MEENLNKEESQKSFKVRPEVITYEDLCQAVPWFIKHPRIADRLMKFLYIDRVNHVHGKYCEYLGVEFSTKLATEEYKWQLTIDNHEILEQFKTGPFITVSNHPFGSYDGIILLHLVGSLRPDFKVMVNLILNKLQAMQPGFIAVDPLKSEDPEKRKVTMHGMREAIKHVREGHPLGFFPAGAISKYNRKLRLEDRKWQPVIMRLIKQLKVPVIPIFFHGRNSTFFNILGLIDWRLRTLRLPRELFASYNKKIRITIGQPVSVETQDRFKTPDELGDFLKQETYKLKNITH